MVAAAYLSQDGCGVSLNIILCYHIKADLLCAHCNPDCYSEKYSCVQLTTYRLLLWKYASFALNIVELYIHPNLICQEGFKDY